MLPVAVRDHLPCPLSRKMLALRWRQDIQAAGLVCNPLPGGMASRSACIIYPPLPRFLLYSLLFILYSLPSRRLPFPPPPAFFFILYYFFFILYSLPSRRLPFSLSPLSSLFFIIYYLFFILYQAAGFPSPPSPLSSFFFILYSLLFILYSLPSRRLGVSSAGRRRIPGFP